MFSDSNDESIAGTYLHAHDDGVVGRPDGVRQDRRLRHAEVVRNRHEIASGQHGVFGVAAGDVHADVPAEVLADRLAPPQAPTAFAAHQVERRRDAFADVQPGDLGADAGDRSGDFMPEDVGQ